MSGFVGIWELTSSENFEELLKHLGLNDKLKRNFCHVPKQTVKITVDGDYWTMATVSEFQNHVVKFKLDEEFECDTFDGRKGVKTRFTLNGDYLVQTERHRYETNKACIITRSVNEKGELIAIAISCDIVSTRTYAKQ